MKFIFSILLCVSLASVALAPRNTFNVRYIYDDGSLQGQDLKNLLKNFGITHDNDLNKKLYGLKTHELLADIDGSKLGQVPAEVTIFSETLAKLFARD